MGIAWTNRNVTPSDQPIGGRLFCNFREGTNVSCKTVFLVVKAHWFPKTSSGLSRIMVIQHSARVFIWVRPPGEQQLKLFYGNDI